MYEAGWPHIKTSVINQNKDTAVLPHFYLVTRRKTETRRRRSHAYSMVPSNVQAGTWLMLWKFAWSTYFLSLYSAHIADEWTLLWGLTRLSSVCLSDVWSDREGMNSPNSKPWWWQGIHQPNCIMHFIVYRSALKGESLYQGNVKRKEMEAIAQGTFWDWATIPSFVSLLVNNCERFSKCEYLETEIFKSARAEENLIYYGLSTHPEDKAWFCGCSGAEIP